MEFVVCFRDFTQSSVESLAKMKHLKYLFINVAEGKAAMKSGKTEEAELLVHAAGRVPNLVKVDFDFKRGGWEFIKAYGQHYPEKNLIIRHLL